MPSAGRHPQASLPALIDYPGLEQVIIPKVTSLTLVTLSNCQVLLEYPFDPKGMDNIKDFVNFKIHPAANTAETIGRVEPLFNKYDPANDSPMNSQT